MRRITAHGSMRTHHQSKMLHRFLARRAISKSLRQVQFHSSAMIARPFSPAQRHLHSLPPIDSEFLPQIFEDNLLCESDNHMVGILSVIN